MCFYYKIYLENNIVTRFRAIRQRAQAIWSLFASVIPENGITSYSSNDVEVSAEGSRVAEGWGESLIVIIVGLRESVTAAVAIGSEA